MIWIFCIFTMIFSGCQQKPQERHYTEVIIEAPQDNASTTSAALSVDNNGAMNNMLSWELPQGWKQEAGEGMRLATFHQVSNPKAIDCSIISLGGSAGGLEFNLMRWSKQIGLQGSPDNLKQLANLAQSLKTKDGLEVKVFDFTTIQVQGNPSDKSMLVAMIVMDNTTVFVKMTGSIESVHQNKNNFLKLVGSIVRK